MKGRLESEKKRWNTWKVGNLKDLERRIPVMLFRGKERETVNGDLNGKKSYKVSEGD